MPNPYDGLSFINTSNSSNDYRTVRERYRQVVSSLGQSYADTVTDSALERDYHTIIDRMQLIRQNEAMDAQRAISSQLAGCNAANFESLGSSDHSEEKVGPSE